MTKVAVVLDRQDVSPGETVTGSVFVNVEGKARSVTVRLVHREGYGSWATDRVVAQEVHATPAGLQAGQRFSFSFPLPLDASPLFRCVPPRTLDPEMSDRVWGVSAQIVRDWKIDHKAFAALDVRPQPPTVPVTALVFPHEIQMTQSNPVTGVNTPQRSRSRLLAMRRPNPADSVGIRCDPPAARRGHALMVDVNRPGGLDGALSLGLFLYHSYWVGGGESRRRQVFREAWAHAVPIPERESERLVLPVPPDQAPTHHGVDVASWWDVRPCWGEGTDEPSQRSSQPVIIRA